MVPRRHRRFWVRGTLLSAICGQWVAHLLLDPNEYAEAGLRFTWRASVPIVVQTMLVLVIVAALGRLCARRGSGERTSIRRRLTASQLLAILAMSQLALFFLMEVSERLVQREPFTEGLFASGFALEILFALVSALLLVLLGSIALRVIRSIRRQAPSISASDSIGPILEIDAQARLAATQGDPRAPPISLAA